MKFKIIALSLGITFLLGVVSVGVLRYIVKLEETTQLNSFEAYAKNLSDSIAAQFFERYGDVQAFSISPAIQSSNKQTIIEMLNTFSAMYGIYDLIMLVDSKGKLVSVNNKGPNGKEISVGALYQNNYSETPWFKAVMAGQFTEDKEKGFSGTYVEDIQLDPWVTQVFGSNRLGSSFSAAVKDSSGKVIGVITNRAGSRWFEVAFRELYTGLKKSGFSHSELVFLNKDGIVFFEYESDPASEKILDPKYDWNRLLKVNLATSNLQSAKNVIANKSGSLIEIDPRTQVAQIIGYVPISSQKFVDKLGWSVLVRDDESEAKASLNRAQNIFYEVFLFVISLSCIISYLVVVSLSKKLSAIAMRLSGGSHGVFSTATIISQSSTELFEAARDQASAIQETAASIDEVSSMVKKSADNASQSLKASQASRNAAEQGQAAIQEMAQAIHEISQSNYSIMTQVEEGNRQISDIVKVIAEIENKTKVINDIVFQTKLLSFNASVEAARAGEHGKGFAVVAEEVGNLAQMSGNAAKEISSMLDASIQKVETIVNDTKIKVERLVVESKSKVEVGTRVAQKCGDVLNNILSTVQEVDGMVGEISSASQEQAQGVSEINKAMNQLDQVTQQNTSVAQSAATSAEELTAEAERLNQVVIDLFLIIKGVSEVNQADVANRNPVDASKQTSRNKNVSLNNLVKMKSKEVSSEKQAPPLAMVVGGGGAPHSAHVPSKDDPRFEDV